MNTFEPKGDIFYGMTKMTDEVFWKRAGGRGFDEIMMKRGAEQPVRIVIPGRLVHSWFFAGAKPANQVTIDIVPLSKNDKKAADELTRIHTGKGGYQSLRFRVLLTEILILNSSS